LDAILREGIRPRGDDPGNWKHTVTSNPRCVYLTTTYPLYFAQMAGEGYGDVAIFEVDGARLQRNRLLPDEDFLQDATKDDPKWQARFEIWGVKGMKARVMWFRREIYARNLGKGLALQSLERMGTCCHDGNVSRETLTRIALIPKDVSIALIAYYDPLVCIMNYHTVGWLHQRGVALMFGDDPDTSDITQAGWHVPPKELLDQITVRTLRTEGEAK
jgi:hypothetical protein